MIRNITICIKGEFCLPPPPNGGAQNPCTGHSLTMGPIPKPPIEAYSKSPEVKPRSKSKTEPRISWQTHRPQAEGCQFRAIS